MKRKPVLLYASQVPYNALDNISYASKTSQEKL